VMLFAEHLQFFLELFCALACQANVRKLRYRQGLVFERFHCVLVRVFDKISSFLTDGLADNLIFPAHTLLDNIIKLRMHNWLDNIGLAGGFILFKPSILDKHSLEYDFILLQFMKLAYAFPASDLDWVFSQ
jgi:hypothetical protein